MRTLVLGLIYRLLAAPSPNQSLKHLWGLLMRWIAALFVCLLVPFAVEAKPSRHGVDAFRGDRWEMVAQAGTSASDVNRIMRCPAPLDCRTRVKRKKWKRWKKPRPPEPGSVKPLARPVIPLPRVRPDDAPEADEDEAAVNGLWNRIAVSLNTLEAPRVLRGSLEPAPLNIFEGFFREVERALLRPIGNCREFETLDRRVKQIVADAARHFGSPALMTSCYRSAAYNRRVYARMGRRPTKSLHIARKAVDFKIAGVSKFEVAKYVRKHRLAGGVGLYCNSIVHVDVGRRRDWNWCGGVKRTRYASAR